MNCHYCGAETNEREIFCRNCGTRQEPVPERAVAEPVPEEETLEYVWKPEPEACEGPAFPNLPVQAEAAPEPKEIRNVSTRLLLPTRRGLGKMVFLGLLTLGIYPLVIWSRLVTELNISASRYDGERTMPFFAMVLLSPFTLGIYALVWYHDFSRRIGGELQRRGLGYRFGARDFWLWNILGILILAGPFVYTYKLVKSMNLINEDFNAKG